MAKVIVNTTNKGGEGKTTNSIVLAEYSALVMDFKTLLIDLDPQANCSSRYLPLIIDPNNKDEKSPPIHPDYEPEIDKDWDGISSIAGIFYGEEVIPYPTSFKNLEIAPSHSTRLLQAEAVRQKEVKEKVHMQLKKFIKEKAVQESYDVIIIDTPPSKGPLAVAAIKAASHIVVPAQMEYFSMQGIFGILQLWKQETYSRTPDDPIKFVGILPNQVKNVKLHKDLLNDLKSNPKAAEFIIPHSIKDRIFYTEMLVPGADPKSVFDLPEQNVARKEYELSCKYIMERVFTNG